MVKIIADSTCDLSKDLLERYDISILPLHILLGEEEYLDGVNITPQEIYSWSAFLYPMICQPPEM